MFLFFLRKVIRDIRVFRDGIMYGKIFTNVFRGEEIDHVFFSLHGKL